MSKLAKLAGVPAPTIKHYIREGLLPGPAQRTSRNMAYYDAKIADRVRAIKELQHRHFLPLRLIGEILQPPPSAEIRQDLDAETREQLGALADSIRSGHASLAGKKTPSTEPRNMTRSQVLERLEITEEDLKRLDELGVLSRETNGQGEAIFQGASLELLEVIDETRRAGLGDMFPMEILGPHVAAVRNLVRVELNLFRQRVLEAAANSDMSLDQIATSVADLGQRLLLAIRSQLLIAETGALAQPWSALPSDGANGADAWMQAAELNGRVETGDLETGDLDSGDLDSVDLESIELDPEEPSK